MQNTTRACIFLPQKASFSFYGYLVLQLKVQSGSEISGQLKCRGTPVGNPRCALCADASSGCTPHAAVPRMLWNLKFHNRVH